jgi:antitoxin HicB
MPDSKSNRPLMGESLGDFLDDLGIREQVDAAAVKEIVAMLIEKALRERAISKAEIASRMRTSRSQVHRILDPKNATVSLQSIVSMASAIGKKVKIELIDA